MTASEIKVLVLVVLLAAAAWFVHLAFGWRDAAQSNKATVEQQDKTAVATSGITTAAGDAQQQGAKLDITVTQARGNYAQQYEELRREDTDVATWAARPIPGSLRKLAAARRSARDGLGGDAAGNPHDDAGAGGSGSSPTP